MVQQGTPTLHQEMFENTVAALLVALARLPSRVTKAQDNEPRREVRGVAQQDKHSKRTKH